MPRRSATSSRGRSLRSIHRPKAFVARRGGPACLPVRPIGPMLPVPTAPAKAPRNSRVPETRAPRGGHGGAAGPLRCATPDAFPILTQAVLAQPKCPHSAMGGCSQQLSPSRCARSLEAPRHSRHTAFQTHDTPDKAAPEDCIRHLSRALCSHVTAPADAVSPQGPPRSDGPRHAPFVRAVLSLSVAAPGATRNGTHRCRIDGDASCA